MIILANRPTPTLMQMVLNLTII